MNRKIETTKIKVNNGQELIAKAKEYKNSGGEWKLLEKYWESPTGEEGNNKNSWGWAIIISNGEKEVNIYSTEGNLSGLAPNNEIEARGELEQLFPEAKFAPLNFDRLEGSTFKKVKEDKKEYNLYHYLVAEKFWDLEKITESYFRENEAKIYNSVNREFSDWVEIINGQDGNIYLYVGEKNKSGGREIKIGIKKEEFDKKETERLKDRGKYFSGSEMLETDWNLYIISSDQPQTPTEKENYYRTLEKTFQEQWPIREKLCRNHWESVAKEMEKAFNYWHEKSRQNQYWNHEANEKGILAKACASEIREELKQNPNIKICSNECHHLHDPSLPKKDNSTPNSPVSPPTSPKTGGARKITDSQKYQLLQYFLDHKITKVTVEDGKLKIEYSSQGATKGVNNSELEKYKDFIQSQPNHSLSLSNLQKTDSNSNPVGNPNNHKLVIGLALGAGGVILIGTIAYLVWKRNNKKK